MGNLEDFPSNFKDNPSGNSIMGLPLFCASQPVLYLAVGAGAKLKSDKITGGG